MRVTVHSPRVVGGRVYYSWDLSEPSDLQHRNRFMIRFHGVPLRRFHRAVLWEVLLTLQVPVWARMGQSVVVTLPEPVPAVVVDWWRAYHDAEHVEFVGPMTPERTYDPGPVSSNESGVGRRGCLVRWREGQHARAGGVAADPSG